MKRISILLANLVLTGFCLSTNAQTSLRFGIKGGLNLSHAKYENQSPLIGYKGNSFAPGINLGGLAELSFPKGSKFKLQLEALYNIHFHNFDFIEGENSRFNQANIQLPLSVKYFIQPDFSLNAGVSGNYNFAYNYKSDITPQLYNTIEVNPIQVGAHLGMTYYINKGFFVDGRYNYLFGSSINNSLSNYDIKHKMGVIQLGLGYKF